MSAIKEKAIRLLIYQSIAHYRIASSIKIQETYPLPPYSTVIGMVHAACGFKEYHDMKVSIAGDTGGQFVAIEKQKTFEASDSASSRGIISSPVRVVNISELHLEILIKPTNEEELEAIYNALKKPANFLSLGRANDLIRMDKVEIVELESVDKAEGEVLCNKDMYMPACMSNKASGTKYTLGKKFAPTKKGKIRIWEEIVPAYIISKDSMLPMGCNSSENAYYYKAEDKLIPALFA